MLWQKRKKKCESQQQWSLCLSHLCMTGYMKNEHTFLWTYVLTTKMRIIHTSFLPSQLISYVSCTLLSIIFPVQWATEIFKHNCNLPSLLSLLIPFSYLPLATQLWLLCVMQISPAVVYSIHAARKMLFMFWHDTQGLTFHCTVNIPAISEVHAILAWSLGFQSLWDEIVLSGVCKICDSVCVMVH